MKILLAALILLSINVYGSDKAEFKHYMERARGNDYLYELATQNIMLSDQQFISKCWNKLSPLSFTLFYTVYINGKASDVIWFPKNIDAGCIKHKILNTTFSKPQETFHGWWLVWDGAGG